MQFLIFLKNILMKTLNQFCFSLKSDIFSGFVHVLTKNLKLLTNISI